MLLLSCSNYSNLDLSMNFFWNGRYLKLLFNLNIASLLTLAFMRIHLTFHKFLLVLNQRKVLIQKETKSLKMYRKQAEP